MNFREFLVVGTPEEQTAKVTLEELKQQRVLTPEQKNAQQEAVKVVGRLRFRQRLALGISGLLAISALVIADRFLNKETPYYPNEVAVVDIPTLPPNRIDNESLPQEFDQEYRKFLIDYLNQKKGDQASRTLAVRDNLVFFVIPHGGVLTALRIDSAGWYVSTFRAMAPFFDAPEQEAADVPTIYEPRTGKVLSALNFSGSEAAGLVIIYAPTGLPRQPVDNLQIGQPEIGQRVWSWSIIPKFNEFLSQAEIVPGRIQTTANLPAGAQAFAGDIFIGDAQKRLKTVGGPVLNEHGIIVGFQAGNLMGDEQFLGGLLAPATNLNLLTTPAQEPQQPKRNPNVTQSLREQFGVLDRILSKRIY